MAKKSLAIIVLIVIASLSVAGCTIGPTTTSPTPTPTPTATPIPTPVDYSSALTTASESANFIMERPFTKSINERGNVVYKGVGRNSTDPSAKSVTLVKEVTKTKNESKKVYDGAVATKLNEGYTALPTEAAKWKSNSCPDCVEVWTGSHGSSFFLCLYRYDQTVNGWMITEQSVST